MNEETAKKILAKSIQKDDSLFSLGWYLAWHKGAKLANLDGNFTVDDLEAISWWMRNKT